MGGREGNGASGVRTGREQEWEERSKKGCSEKKDALWRGRGLDESSMDREPKGR